MYYGHEQFKNCGTQLRIGVERTEKICIRLSIGYVS